MVSNCDDHRYLIQFKRGLFSVFKAKHIDTTSKKFIIKSVIRNKRVGLPLKFDEKRVYGVAILATASNAQMCDNPVYKSLLITPRTQLSADDYYSEEEIKGICQLLYNPADFSEDSSTDQEEVKMISNKTKQKQKRYSVATSKTETDFQASQSETDAFTKSVEELTIQKYTAYDRFEKTRSWLESNKKEMSRLFADDCEEDFDIVLLAKFSYMAYIYSQMCVNLLKTYPGGYKFNEIPPYRIVGEILLIDNKWPIDFQIVANCVKKAKSFEEHFRDISYLAFTHAELKNTSMTGKSKPSSGGEKKDLVKINERKISLVFKTAADIYSIHHDKDNSENIRRANICARAKDMQKSIREFLNYNREPTKHTKEEMDLREKYPNYPVFYTRNAIMSVLENPPFWLRVYLEDVSIIDLLQENADKNAKYAEYVRANEINTGDPFYIPDTSGDSLDIPSDQLLHPEKDFDQDVIDGIELTDEDKLPEKPTQPKTQPIQASQVKKQSKRLQEKKTGEKRPINSTTQDVSSKKSRK